MKTRLILIAIAIMAFSVQDSFAYMKELSSKYKAGATVVATAEYELPGQVMVKVATDAYNSYMGGMTADDAYSSATFTNICDEYLWSFDNNRQGTQFSPWKSLSVPCCGIKMKLYTKRECRGTNGQSMAWVRVDYSWN